MGLRGLERQFDRFRREGDSEALGAVFDATAAEILKVAAYLARDPASAEDLLQRTFLTAIEAAPKWDRSRRLLPWLLGILANHTKDESRRAARSLEPARLAQHHAEDPVAAASHREAVDAAGLAIDELPDPARSIFALRYRRGLEPAEIALALGIPPATVRSHLHRGTERVRRKLPSSLAVVAGFDLPTRGIAEIRRVVVARATVVGATIAASAGVGAGTSGLVIGGIHMARWTIALAAGLLFVAGGISYLIFVRDAVGAGPVPDRPTAALDVEARDPASASLAGAARRRAVNEVATVPAVRDATRGSLDPTFGGGTGVVVASGIPYSGAVAIQRINGSERYLVAGGAIAPNPTNGLDTDWVVRAYTPDGSLDPTFGAGANGTVRLFEVDRVRSVAADVSFDEQNRVVMGGVSTVRTGATNCQVLTVVRLTPDGRLDTSFNGTGIATVWAGSPDGYPEWGLSAVAVPASLGGGVLATGMCWYVQSPARGELPAQINRRTFLAKFRDNGTLDPNFGTNGIAYDPRSSYSLRSTRLQRDGKIVVAHAMDYTAQTTFAGLTQTAAYGWVISRFSATGELDTTFGSNGRVIRSGAVVGAVRVNATDDSIVVLGGSEAGGDGVIARYLENGALDPAFGIDGYAPVTGWVKGSCSLAIQPDGRVVVCGHTLVGSVQHGLLARLAADGSPDTSFGGTAYADPLPGAWWAAVAEADEGIVVAGWAAPPGSTSPSLVARYGK